MTAHYHTRSTKQESKKHDFRGAGDIRGEKAQRPTFIGYRHYYRLMSNRFRQLGGAAWLIRKKPIGDNSQAMIYSGTKCFRFFVTSRGPLRCVLG